MKTYRNEGTQAVTVSYEGEHGTQTYTIEPGGEFVFEASAETSVTQACEAAGLVLDEANAPAGS